ncbi:YncE family protein [Aquabacterium sp.]|uniref:YncE family protein n=1 Tax=Aquabacterium sp. TaxID=1872578 RepID=UPI0025B88079|nr:YncE family protein [Aquabacterium sp.]
MNFSLFSSSRRELVRRPLGAMLHIGLLWGLVSSTALAQSAPAPQHPIFALNSLDATISIIDPVSFKELRRVPTGKEPHHLYLSPDEKSLLVANALSDSLTLLDPRTGQVQRVIDGISDPYQLRFSPDMKWLVTVANRLDHVDIYRSTPNPAGGVNLTLAKRVPSGKTPSHVYIDTRSTVAYVSMQDSDELVAVDLATQALRWKIKVGKMPADVFLTPDDKQLLVALTGDSVVEVYDVSGAKPVLSKRIKTADGAHAFRAWGDKRHVLVSNRVANTISKIDMQTMTVVDNYPAPGGPDCMDFLADGKTIMVTSRWARKVTFIDTTTRKVVRQVPVGRSPHGVWTLDHAPRQ